MLPLLPLLLPTLLLLKPLLLLLTSQMATLGLTPTPSGPPTMAPPTFAPSNLGPTNHGPSNHGPTNLGPTNLGPWTLGPWNLGPCKLDTVPVWTSHTDWCGRGGVGWAERWSGAAPCLYAGSQVGMTLSRFASIKPCGRSDRLLPGRPLLYV